MFFLKKIISPLLFPLPVLMLLLLAGLLLLWFTRRQRAGKVIITVSFLLLLVMSYSPVPDFFMRRIEQKYPPLDLSLHPAQPVPESLSAVKWIVVLGGGHSSDPKIPAASNLYSGTLYRLVEGVELHRKLSGTRLVFSGSAVWRNDSEAAAMARTAEGLGVEPQDIVLEERANDTEEQAKLIKPIIGTDSFILVTTASHMPRAVALFTKEGMNPIPAPTEYRVAEADYMPRDYYPSPGNLHKSELVVYETVGLLWAKLRGKG